jgi:hypothetical protein
VRTGGSPWRSYASQYLSLRRGARTVEVCHVVDVVDFVVVVVVVLGEIFHVFSLRGCDYWETTVTTGIMQ